MVDSSQNNVKYLYLGEGNYLQTDESMIGGEIHAVAQYQDDLGNIERGVVFEISGGRETPVLDRVNDPPVFDFTPPHPQMKMPHLVTS